MDFGYMNHLNHMHLIDKSWNVCFPGENIDECPDMDESAFRISSQDGGRLSLD